MIRQTRRNSIVNELELRFHTLSHRYVAISLRCRHNGRDGVSNHQSHHCLLNRLFRRRSKKTSKLFVIGLCDRWPVNSPHKWPVTRKCFHLMTSMLLVTGLWAGNSTGTSEFPAQLASNAEMFPTLTSSWYFRIAWSCSTVNGSSWHPRYAWELP